MDVNDNNETPRVPGVVEFKQDDNKPEANTPTETGALMMDLYSMRLKSLLDKLSNKEMRRVLLSIIEAPVITELPKSKEGQEAFQIADGMQQAKFMLFLEMLGINLQEQTQESELVTTEQTQGEENGTNETN